MRHKLLLLACLLFAGTTGLFAQKHFKNAISPEFKDFAGVLLVQKPDVRGIDGKMEKRFEKNYKGPFEYIEDGDLNSPKYKDLSKYRFVFIVEWMGWWQDQAQYRMLMTDRLNKSTFQSGIRSGNTIPPYNEIGQYAASLEEMRAK